MFPEFQALYEIAQFTSSVLAKPFSTDLIELQASKAPLPEGAPMLIEARFVTANEKPPAGTLLSAPELSIRVFQLLRTHMLGHAGTAKVGATLPASLLLEKETAGRLWSVLE